MTEWVRMSFNIGRYRHPVSVQADDKYYYFDFPYNPALKDEIKAMEGQKYLGFEKINPRKIWRVNRSKRNEFQLAYLRGLNPYVTYDTPPPAIDSPYPLLSHQAPGAAMVVHTHGCILAHEMGLGKSLTVQAAAEWLYRNRGIKSGMWLAPKSALNSVRLDLEKWGFFKHCPNFTFELMNYEKLVGYWGNPQKGVGKSGAFIYPPQLLVVDESQRVKTHTAQRSQAVYDLAETVRSKWGDSAYITLLSGSPAPRTPADWWHQCEIACPGFLREGSHKALVSRLAWVQLQEGVGQQKFNKVEGWKDDEDKCQVCGLRHRGEASSATGTMHAFKESFNEVKHLYKRMQGLVDVKFKKDCLDLPPKTYEVRVLTPSADLLRKAKLVKATARRTVDALTKLRELSDGFLYKETPTDKTTECEYCEGTGAVNEKIMPGAPHCLGCSGTGRIVVIERTAVRTTCPKDDALSEILDEHYDIGRLAIYCGFEASVDRCVEIAAKEQWQYIRADGRGWVSSLGNDVQQLDMLKEFQKPVDNPFSTERTERLVFIGHPGAAGTGLTLTASPTILYYSNDFNAENRIQSEDRIHRIGQSANARIIDLINLPTDQLVLDNLKKKRELQAMTLGDVFSILPDEERHV